MQTTQYMSDAHLDDIIEAVYVAGAPIVKEAYSNLDTPTVAFPSPTDLRQHIQFVPEQRAFFHYALYYPEAKGFVLEKRIDLKPGSCKVGRAHV